MGEEVVMDTIYCPNGHGELETAYGYVYTLNGEPCFEVTVEYCPVCYYIGNVDVDL